MARPRTSNHLKLVRGTDQPCRMHAEEVQYDPITEKLDAPDWLDIRAKKYWDRIVPILQSKRVITEVDVEALAVMCMLYGKVRQAAEAGTDVNASVVTQLRLYQQEFGLTPVSRNKIPAGDDGKKGNRFKANGAAGRAEPEEEKPTRKGRK